MKSRCRRRRWRRVYDDRSGNDPTSVYDSRAADGREKNGKKRAIQEYTTIIPICACMHTHTHTRAQTIVYLQRALLCSSLPTSTLLLLLCNNSMLQRWIYGKATCKQLLWTATFYEWKLLFCPLM